MIYVSVETKLSRQPELVWDVLTDVTSLPAWVEGLVAAEVDDDAKPGVGLEIRVVRRDGPRRASATCVVTAWREPALLAVETRAGRVLVLDSVRLEPAGDGTRLIVASEIVVGSRVAGLFARRAGLWGAPRDPFAERLQSIYERSIDALVKRVESFTAVPYR